MKFELSLDDAELIDEALGYYSWKRSTQELRMRISKAKRSEFQAVEDFYGVPSELLWPMQSDEQRRLR